MKESDGIPLLFRSWHGVVGCLLCFLYTASPVHLHTVSPFPVFSFYFLPATSLPSCLPSPLISSSLKQA